MTSGSAPCVYCRRHPMVAAYRPFCSERCRMADLGQWLGGGYVVAAATPGDGSEADDASGLARPETAEEHETPWREDV